jgi:hypothetical protein
MSGLGEGIAAEIIIKVLFTCFKIGETIVQNYKHFARDSEDHKARLQVQLFELSAIKTSFEIENGRKPLRVWDIPLFEYILRKVHGILRKFQEKFCPAPTGIKRLAFNGVTTTVASLDATEELVRLSRLAQEAEDADVPSALVLQWKKVKWALYEKSVSEKLVAGVEFWTERVYKMTRHIIPPRYLLRGPAEIDHDLGASVFKTEAHILTARSPLTTTSHGSAVELQSLTPADPLLKADELLKPNTALVEDDDLKTLTNLGVDEVERRWLKYRGHGNSSAETVVILETKYIETSMEGRTNLQVLLKSLQAAHESRNYHVLDCLGYTEMKHNLAVIFKPPRRTHPPFTATLTSLLSTPERCKDFSSNLENRVKLAKALSWTLSEIHNVSWVHEGINTDNVLLFSPEGTTPTYDWSMPYLVGFQTSRARSGNSGRSGLASSWMSLVHTHPERRRDIYVRFEAKHDIYSLGVLLLEIGCMEVFSSSKWEAKMRCLTPEDLRERLLELADEKLPPALGTTYFEVTRKCLTGLQVDGVDDRGNKLDMEDKYARLLKEFSSQVCWKLDSIQI